MSDALDGLRALEQVVETIGEQLHDLYESRQIPQLERVHLGSLEWVIAKLADDLVEADTELRNARLQAASTSRELVGRAWESGTEALRKQLAEVTAERDAARESLQRLQDAERQRNEFRAVQTVAAMELERRAAELSKKIGELPAEPAEPYQWQVGDEIVGADGTTYTISQVIGGLLWSKNKELAACEQWWLSENGFKLHRKASDLPAPEPGQWQVGDEVVRNGDVRSVEVVSRGYVKLYGLYSCGAQSDWERAGWTLQRKASDLPRHDELDDSVGADGEGQS